MKLEKNVTEVWIIEKKYKENWYVYGVRTNEEHAKNLLNGLNKTKGEHRISKFVKCSHEQIKINLEECYMNGKTT